jgi:hypothetical protein
MEETKFCSICEKTKPLAKFILNSDGSIRKHVCKACYASKWRAQLKLEMLESFGWKCQCCGEDNPHFLTLDHLNNDGNVHRKEVKSGSVEVIYAAAKREGWPKDRYQLLCINCNWAKGKWGVCPHVTGKSSQDVIDELKSKIFHTGKSLQNMNLEPLKLGPKAQSERANDPHKQVADLLEKLSPEEFTALLARYSKS